MKRIVLFLSIMLCFTSIVFAESATIKQANNLYIKGNYTDAAKLYENIFSNEGVAAELYYNLGNAYYKSGETAKSILNYERALRLKPTFDDARFNLELAQSKVVDNIIQAPTFFLGRWIENLIKLLTSNQWLIISALLFLISLILVFLFVFATTLIVRKISFYIGTVLLTLCVAGAIFSGVRKAQLVSHNEAIVMSGVVSVKSSPDLSGTDLFQLHEGTKVTVKSTLGKWIEIKLGNGNVGWVEQENIEKI